MSNEPPFGSLEPLETQPEEPTEADGDGQGTHATSNGTPASAARSTPNVAAEPEVAIKVGVFLPPRIPSK